MFAVICILFPGVVFAFIELTKSYACGFSKFKLSSKVNSISLTVELLPKLPTLNAHSSSIEISVCTSSIFNRDILSIAFIVPFSLIYP